ncbi:uncharacterized protein FRV6_01351 [Fusarium oxysporum]|uniref:Uncharacterized protein n=2 Tax=Fusarium oxysporum TaxID=5507 RepID=A0A2H3SPQ8_FUSOX|nr:hypothetical protein BKA60DRAFT_542145 [Fusarium oxysporum]RKK85803.1 hypothetical protein BFJ69_g1411 [Fusarium oxysporum]SCO77139.1 uncharacterized protein FRV6_01351 [Fusarium oxysporum]
MTSLIKFTALLFIFVKIVGTAPPEHIFQKPEDFQRTDDDVENAHRHNANIRAWYDVHRRNRRWDIYLGLWLAKLAVALHTLVVTNGHFPGSLAGWCAYVVVYFFLAEMLMIVESFWGIACVVFGWYNLPAMWFNLRTPSHFEVRCLV